MKPKVKISLVNKENEGFMGIGLVWLLKRIEEFKSINRAAKDMNLSYAKALKILNRLEENLGRPILVRKKGGKERGGTELTPFARKFIREYEKFNNNVTDYARKRFLTFHEILKFHE